MSKHNLSKEELLELEPEDDFESDECNCTCCIAERKLFDDTIIEEAKLETKNGFKLGELL